MTNAPQVEQRPRRLWLLWTLLILSLSLNLLFVGLIAGSRWHDGPRGSPVARALEGLSEKLPATKQPVAKAALERYQAEVRPMRGEVREARRAMIEAIQAEPFNEQNFTAAAERVQTMQSDMRKRVTVIMADLMKQLTVEERKEFMRSFRGPRGEERGGRERN